MRELEREPESNTPSGRAIIRPKAAKRPKRNDNRATILANRTTILATRTEDLAAKLLMMQLQENVFEIEILHRHRCRPLLGNPFGQIRCEVLHAHHRLVAGH